MKSEAEEMFGDPSLGLGLDIWIAVGISTGYNLLSGNTCLLTYLSSYSTLHILPRDVGLLSWKYLLTYTAVIAVQVLKVHSVRRSI